MQIGSYLRIILADTCRLRSWIQITHFLNRFIFKYHTIISNSLCYTPKLSILVFALTYFSVQISYKNHVCFVYEYTQSTFTFFFWTCWGITPLARPPGFDSKWEERRAAYWPSRPSLENYILKYLLAKACYMSSHIWVCIVSLL